MAPSYSNPGSLRPEVRRALLAVALAIAFAVPARAEGPIGCTGFAWPVDLELEWMKAAAVTISGGLPIPGVPTGALDLSLSTDAKLPFPPSGRPDPAPQKPHAGFVTISKVARPGLVQVSVSGSAWVDVFQNRAVVPEESETVSASCPILNKSMRFRLSEGPATIQVSDSPDTHIKLTIREVPAH
jgi:hypothetical protein